MERPQIEVYKTAYSEQMAGKISVPFKILIDVCDYALNLESQLHQEREKRKRSEVENTKLREVARVAGQIQYMVEHYIRCCGGSTNIDIAEEYNQALIDAGYGGGGIR